MRTFMIAKQNIWGHSQFHAVRGSVESFVSGVALVRSREKPIPPLGLVFALSRARMLNSIYVESACQMNGSSYKPW